MSGDQWPNGPSRGATHGSGRPAWPLDDPGPSSAAGSPGDIFVPDGASRSDAFGRVTDLGIVAHPDDLEFLAVGAIGEGATNDDRWFGGVVCTDGAGSASSGGTSPIATTRELAGLRLHEQRAAARLGGYSVVVQLAHPSGWVRSRVGQEGLVDQLEAVLRAARPVNLYTHNLADKHDTHVAVGSATVKAVRRLPMTDRPVRMVGVEGWRDLDWLPDHEKVRMDVSRFAGLAESLTEVFQSQLADKRYDLAAEGRRRANATLFEPRQPDDADQVVVAMDLTPLARNDDVDPIRFIRFASERFRDEVEHALSPYW